MVWQNLTKQPALSLLPGLSLDQALNELIQNKMLAAPVVADGQFIGILTLLDILSKTSEANRLHLTVQEVLIANPPRLTAGGELPAVPKGDLPFYPVVAENGFF